MTLLNHKRITSVKKAKKHLKSEKHWRDESKPTYTMIKWDRKRKSFLVDERGGQRVRIFDIYVKIC